MSDEEGDSLFVSDADVLRHEADQNKPENQEGSQDAVMEDAPQNTDEKPPIPEPVNVPGDEDDPVVQSFPVFFSNTLADKLHLFQYPTRSVSYPLVEALNTGILESRLKPKSGIIEVDAPIDTQRFYDQDKGERWSKPQRQVMGGVLKDPQKNEDGSVGSKYMVGVFKNEELHVTPIKAVAQLRPQFRYIDNEKDTENEIVRNVNSEQASAAGKTAKKEARAIQMSAKASGDQAPRYSGALSLRKQADEEEFVGIDWYDRDCDESWREGDKLVTVDRTPLQSKTTIDDYITELQK